MLVEWDRIEETIPNLADESIYAVERIQAAVEDTVEKYCGRKFALANYDELIHGTGQTYLFVKQRPIVSVSAVRYGLYPGLQVSNINQDNYNATITVGSTSIVCAHYPNSGSPVTTTITYASNPTFQAVCDAINAIGSGWKAFVAGADITGWVSTDLAAIPGTFGVRTTTSQLLFHRWFHSNFRINPEVGEIHSITRFTPGYNNYRIQYAAGYATIPDDLQNVICELTRSAWQSVSVNANLTSESLGSYSYTLAADRGMNSLSLTSRRTLELYRSYDLGRWC